MRLRRALRNHVFAHYKRARQSRDICLYVQSHSVRKLNVGCGPNRLDGWLNVDVTPGWNAVYMDAARRWPFPDDCFDLLLCEHMIEHIPKDRGSFLIREAFRTLAPGGKARFVTPDLSVFSRMLLHPEQRETGLAYLDVMKAFYRTSDASWCDLVNYCFYKHGHRYIYTPEELSLELVRAGFLDIVETRAASPSDPAFCGVEGHVRVVGAAADAFEAFGLEAVKAKRAAKEAPLPSVLVTAMPSASVS